MDLPDPTEAQGWIKAGSQMLDLVKNASQYLKRPGQKNDDGSEPESVNPDLEKSFFGDPNGLTKFNRELNGLLRSTARPFLLRVGSRITIPGDDQREMKDAVNRKEVWDWTYVFDAENLSNFDRAHIARTYFDGPDKPKDGVSTSVLKATRSPLPPNFGDGIIIVGVTLEAGDFTALDSVDKDLMIPTRAVICRNGEKATYSVVTDAVALRVWLEQVIEVVVDHEPQTIGPRGYHAKVFFDGIDQTPPTLDGSFEEYLIR